MEADKDEREPYHQSGHLSRRYFQREVAQYDDLGPGGIRKCYVFQLDGSVFKGWLISRRVEGIDFALSVDELEKLDGGSCCSRELDRVRR